MKYLSAKSNRQNKVTVTSVSLRQAKRRGRGCKKLQWKQEEEEELSLQDWRRQEGYLFAQYRTMYQRVTLKYCFLFVDKWTNEGVLTVSPTRPLYMGYISPLLTSAITPYFWWLLLLIYLSSEISDYVHVFLLLLYNHLSSRHLIVLIHFFFISNIMSISIHSRVCHVPGQCPAGP